jgi:hypothetical protein
MSNTNRITNRVLSLLCLSALLTASGCALVENFPLVSPLAAGRQHHHGPTCGCGAEDIPCYGYHPTQWHPWPAWCESACIPCAEGALYEVEVVPAGEPTLVPPDQPQGCVMPPQEQPQGPRPPEVRPSDREGRPEVPEQTVPPPSDEPPVRSPGSDFAAGADGIRHGVPLP